MRAFSLVPAILVFSSFSAPSSSVDPNTFRGETKGEGSTAVSALSAGDWEGIRAAHEAGRRRIFVSADGFRARNPGQGWALGFDGRGATVTPDEGSWSWGLELACFGWGERLCAVERPRTISAREDRVGYEWSDALTEWYVNDRLGLEHGFTFRERPADASGPLRLTLSIRGGLEGLVSADGRNVTFHEPGGNARIVYTGLTVLDAHGRALAAGWRSRAGELELWVDERGACYPLLIDPLAQQAYMKASNTDQGDGFGRSVSVWGDTVVVGAPFESSSATGVNGDQSDNQMVHAGAAYVFVRNGTTWRQQAYLKASNTGEPAGHYPNGDQFGTSVSISGDTLVVGAPFESSDATGVNGDGSDNSEPGAGAAYVFARSGTTWSQQAYLKASNSDSNDRFGHSVSVSGDTVVVGAPIAERTPSAIGAAYVFVRNGTTWSQQALLDSASFGSAFGWSVAVSGDTLVAGAPADTSAATGVDGDPDLGHAADSGAAHVLVRSGTTWSQQAYLKASNTGAGDEFGRAVALSGDRVVVGAWLEDSGATGVDGDGNDDGASNSGAAYLFARSGTSWSQQAYLKASNTGGSGAVPGDPYGDAFGWSVAISGEAVVVGAWLEDSDATGIDGDGSNDSARDSGAAYVFGPDGASWVQRAYVKACNTDSMDQFGYAVAADGGTLVVGAPQEASSATGVGGDPDDDGAGFSGATYLFTLEDSVCLVLDFETEDDWATPLVNGQHLDTEFGRLVTLSSSGPNAGLAVFDATPHGPNDPSQDPDLLVGGGNVLILQTENYPPDGHDVFPRPNDDEDGGVMTFVFAVPVEPRNVRLIDIDASDGWSSIVLTDSAARHRTYWIPPGWTGDHALSQPGQGTLGLVTLLPQPGFVHAATASEEPGFASSAVVRLDFHLNGSGALDDLRVCPSVALATATHRSGVDDPAHLACVSLPVLGGICRLSLDGGGAGTPAAVTLGTEAVAWMSPFGEVLVGGSLHRVPLHSRAGSVSQFAWSVPLDLSLRGLELHAQGLCWTNRTSSGAGKSRLMQARLSNAVDLVLGF